MISTVSERDKQQRAGTQTLALKVIADNKLVFDGTNTQASGTVSFTQTRDLNLNIVESGNLRYLPANEVFQFPLTPGVSTFAFERMQIDSGRIIGMDGAREVKPLAKVVTKAGEFEAYEIIVNGRLTDPKTKATAKYELHIWYAPTVQFWIKQTFVEYTTTGREFDRQSAEVDSYKLQPR